MRGRNGDSRSGEKKEEEQPRARKKERVGGPHAKKGVCAMPLEGQ